MGGLFDLESTVDAVKAAAAAESSWQGASGVRAPRLGLALAGGGFRASWFHVGVLRRMAELDLLRYVQVLSTVSGGSIVGALYVLLLKRRLEAFPDTEGPAEVRLSCEEYVEIVKELQDALNDGVRKNLRTRLLMNPWTIFKVSFLEYSLAGEMGRLYEKFIFGHAVEGLRNELKGKQVIPRQGPVPLGAIQLRRDALGTPSIPGTQQYNVIALDPQNDSPDHGPGSALTRLILNATSLNSGARFWFSHAEIGDWFLGHFRYNEIDSELLPRKLLRDLPAERRRQLIDAWPRGGPAQPWGEWTRVVDEFGQRWHDELAPDQLGALKKWGRDPAHRKDALFLQWAVERGRSGVRAKGSLPTTMPLQWLGPVSADDFDALLATLLQAEPGRLRDAKNHAWYLARGHQVGSLEKIRMARRGLWVMFWEALKQIDDERGRALEREFHDESRVSTGEPAWCATLLDGVLNAYFCQSSAAMSPTLRQEWDRFPLADAVAASAAFPPAFPPYQLHKLYDDLHVQLVSLTDGGAFDNLGITALLDEHCNHVIVSDTGGDFETRKRTSPIGRLGMMRRLSSIMMYRPTQLARHELNERRRLGRAAEGATSIPDSLAQFAAARQLDSLVLLTIDAPDLEGATLRTADPRLVSRLRTDLDVFGSIEIECLLNRGYAVADQYLRARLKGRPFDPDQRAHAKVPSWLPAEKLPFAMNADDRRVVRILKAGEHRFLRALRLHAPLTTGVVVTLLLAGVVAVWVTPVTWGDVLAGAAKWLGKLLADWAVPYQWLVDRVAGWIPFTVVATLIVLALIAWVLFRESISRKVWSPVTDLAVRDYLGWLRKGATIARHARSLKTNLLWVFKLLPLAVFAIPVVALVSHLLFALPFVHRTRDPEGLDKPESPKATRAVKATRTAHA